MKVRFKRGWWKTYGTLTPGNVYRVITIEGDQLRLMDDAGEPILFAANAFDVMDRVRPSDWIEDVDEDGERYACPRELSARGFFEDWHDRVPDVRAKLSAYLHKMSWLEAEASDGSANTYLRVRWKHSNSKEPVLQYSELDEERYEGAQDRAVHGRTDDLRRRQILIGRHAAWRGTCSTAVRDCR